EVRVRIPQALTLLVLTVLVSAASADPLPEGEVPAPLRTWVPWVLHDADQRACPYLPAEESNRQCIWPGTLRLELGRHGGRFALRIEVFRESHLALPGDAQ